MNVSEKLDRLQAYADRNRHAGLPFADTLALLRIARAAEVVRGAHRDEGLATTAEIERLDDAFDALTEETG